MGKLIEECSRKREEWEMWYGMKEEEEEEEEEEVEEREREEEGDE